MRIIAGVAKGRKIYSGDIGGTRPTLDRVKESLFNIIEYPLNCNTVLDLFAGTGNLGLEALSRGADFATFVDINKECCKLIRRNVDLLNFNDISEIINIKSESFLQMTKQKYDIIFMDPPYHNQGLIYSAINIICEKDILKDGGIIIIEHDDNFKPKCKPNDIRKYGSTFLSFYNKEKLLTFKNFKNL
ncbi:MAG: 16S rRNA (guanine(966)-N(2))-methyltransferase RsmD [Clostridia bacterium]